MSESQLKINNLVYTVPAKSTLAVQKNDQKNYFDQRNYNAGQTIRCVLQTGSRYVNTFESQLCFTATLSAEAGATASWANGSSINVIKNVRVYHKNGTELVNIQNQNVNQMIEDKAGRPKSWFDAVGNMAGYDAQNSATGLGTSSVAFRADPLVGGNTLVQIPLPCVAPIFNPEGKVLMPGPSLADGLILEIDLATSAEAIVRTGGAADVDLTINDIYLNLSTTVLSDLAVGSLNENAANNLLEYSYIDTYTSRITQSAQNSVVSTSINKAVSMADHISVVEIEQSNRNNQTADEFNMNADTVSYQFTVGSIQLPSQVFVEGTRLGYKQLLKTYGTYAHNKSSAISYINYAVNLNAKTTSFSKDQMLAMSNMPINSSRSLRYEQKYDTPPSNPRVIYVFLHYLKVLQLSITDVKVDI
jgi:hypothetical protein